MIVVCGPTASGKSRLSDEIASSLTERMGSWAPNVVVDSMQVYREIPIITNQARERPAELVGVTSVCGEWTVADHRAAAREATENVNNGPVVLDAGTGMYLNAVLLDFPLAPKVSPEVRRRAEEAVMNMDPPPSNPRRAVREHELLMSGAPGRGSVWEGGLLFDATFLYLRPGWETLRSAIDERSSAIVRDGVEEAALLDEMEASGSVPNPSVAMSIGVRELREYLNGELRIQAAEDRIAARTRRLARRQIRWFDKLVRTLREKTRITILESSEDISHYMHDIIEG